MAKRKLPFWVLIMDGARGQVFDLTTSPVHLTPRSDGTFAGSRLLTQDLTSDRPGHGQESVGGARHALEPRTDAHRHREEIFASEIAKWLTAENNKKAYGRLVVIAPPRALGDLRGHIPKSIRERKVVLEIAGDWTKMSATEAAKHLHPHLLEAGLSG